MLVSSVLKSNQIAQHVIADVVMGNKKPQQQRPNGGKTKFCLSLGCSNQISKLGLDLTKRVASVIVVH